MSTWSADRRKVVSLFGLVGVLSAGIMLIALQLGFRSAISVVTGLPFAAMMLLTAWAASNQGWLSLPRSSPANRDWAAGLLFAFSHPMGLLLALGISFALTPAKFLDFDEHPEGSFSQLEVLQNRVAIPIGGFVGAFVALLICVIAVNVLIGKWPKHAWSWALFISLMMTIVLVPSITVGNERVLLFAWYSALGTVIGYWICEASEKTVEA